MGLFSALKSSPDTARASAAAADAHDIVQEARSRARRRLIGAAVLLGIGIIGFPLLFETQPRPIPVDIPIEIPSRDGAPPLMSPATRPGVARAPADADLPANSAPVKPVADAPASRPTEPERPAAATEAAPARPASVATPPEPRPAAAPKPVEPRPAPAKPGTDAIEQVAQAKAAEAKAAEQKAAQAKAAQVKAAEAKAAEAKAAEARASESKPAPKSTDAAADTGRWVVQIGAFAEVGSAREARMKVEAMGLKTYTQVIESNTGRRIRVRVGPYASKADAEKAAARIRSGGLQTALLLL